MGKVYSGKQIIKAGEVLIDDNSSEADYDRAMNILSYWRFSHEASLNLAFRLMQTVCHEKDETTIFAKRLKRTKSIVNKLRRFEKMTLKNMQDIGGCRAVFSNKKNLNKAVKVLRSLKEFNAVNERQRYKNYIETPKEGGYRSYHLIGVFPDQQNVNKKIEFQLRTQLQHYWATALEIVDLFTGQALKSNQGEDNWKTFFNEVSKQFAIMDNFNNFSRLDPQQKLITYHQGLIKKKESMASCFIAKEFCRELEVFEKLNAYSNSLKVVDERISAEEQAEYFLLEVDLIEKSVTTTSFSLMESGLAEEEYLIAEKKASSSEGLVVALVSTSSVGDIKEVYPNFFADSTQFMNHLLLIDKLDIKVENGRFPLFKPF